MATPKEDNIFDEIADAVDTPPAKDGDKPEVSLAEDPMVGSPDVDAGSDAEDQVHPDVTALVEERDALKDRLLRAMAEAENVRKRGERDRREAEQFGGAKLARDMLPVFDNLKRALDAGAGQEGAISDAEKAILDGVELTMRELLNIFSRHGITLISPAQGDPFDPQLHQAMFEAPVPTVAKGCIIQVMAEGFLLHDRLLRPAQVGVSSTPA